MTRFRTFFSEAAERLIATAILILMLAVLLAIAAAIHLTSIGPVLVAEESPGKKRLPVRTYRFRTRGPGTRLFEGIGRLLRRFRLDEYPVFWSVTKGDISLAEALERIRR